MYRQPYRQPGCEPPPPSEPMSHAEMAELRAELRAEAVAKERMRLAKVAAEREQLAKAAIERVEAAPLGSTVSMDLDSFLAIRSVYMALVEPVGYDMVVIGRTVTYRATVHPAYRPAFG